MATRDLALDRRLRIVEFVAGSVVAKGGARLVNEDAWLTEGQVSESSR